MSVSELAVFTQPEGQRTPAIPSAGEFEAIMRQADVISRSGIVPTAYRSAYDRDGSIREDKRANVVVAALTGRTFGWDVITAMRNIHVIEGAASLKPEAMLGLIRAQGHRVKIVRHPDGVTVEAKRADNGDEYAGGFSIDDGVRAGLCTLKDGKPFARSNYGKPLPWEQYPVDMCQWRAVAQVARGLFPDVVLGLGYTPEELGAIVDAEGEVTIETAPMPTVNPREASAPASEPASPPRTAEQAPPAPDTHPDSPEAATEADTEADSGDVVDADIVADTPPDVAPPAATADKVEECEETPDPGAVADDALACPNVDELRATYKAAVAAGIAADDVSFVLDPPTTEALRTPVGPVPLGALIMAAARHLTTTGKPVRPH